MREPKKKGIKPKHDYSGDKFYKEINTYAMQGMTDAEIADAMDLNPEVFSRMKNGKYQGWTKKENEEFSLRMCQVLEHGRRKINSIVRSAYLKSAIGGKRIRTVVKRYVQDRCMCEGSDKKCDNCGGTGWVQLTDKAIAQETEAELPPNMQALSTWLYHHDEDWRKIERKLDEEANIQSQYGIDTDKWMEENESKE